MSRASRPRRPPPTASDLGLYWRVFADTGAIPFTAFVLLAFTPANARSTVTPGRLVVPFVWLVTILIGNTVLLRLSLTPLPRLTGPMRAVDRLDPGERLDATRTAAAAG